MHCCISAYFNMCFQEKLNKITTQYSSFLGIVSARMPVLCCEKDLQHYKAVKDLLPQLFLESLANDVT